VKRTVLLAALAVVAGGCGAHLRGWQEETLATHDAQLAFDAGKEVLSRHFELGETSWTRGTIETKPRAFDKKGLETLADLRGGGGGWRRMAVCEFDRDGLSIVARVAVRLERQASPQAMEAAQQGEEGPGREVPSSVPRGYAEGSQGDRDVWTDAGYDDAMARELLGEIVERVRQMEAGEALPKDQTPGEALEEGKRIGAEQGF